MDKRNPWFDNFMRQWFKTKYFTKGFKSKCSFFINIIWVKIISLIILLAGLISFYICDLKIDIVELAKDLSNMLAYKLFCTELDPLSAIIGHKFFIMIYTTSLGQNINIFICVLTEIRYIQIYYNI